MGSYRTPSSLRKPSAGAGAGADMLSQPSSTSSSDESANADLGDRIWRTCRSLGFSASEASSLDGGSSLALGVSVAEKFLSTLLRRYPTGKIFNFDVTGELQSSDSSDDDGSSSYSSEVAEPWANHQSPTVSATSGSRSGHHKNPWSRQREASLLLEAFPGARSIAFFPIWDPRMSRWYAGGFIYSKSPTRMFTLQGELSYLRAFGMLTASEVLRFDTVLADQAKSDALGSLSHELRSPLHGVLLSAELLADTDLNVFQGNLAHTVETCSRTLLDTIDHLLDYSKINNFSGRKEGPTAESRAADAESKLFGKKSLFSSFKIDGLLEEVVESVFAGFNFQHLSSKKTSNGGHTKAIEHHESTHSSHGDLQLGSTDVLVFISIDPLCNWMHYVPVGAVRRIIMNLFGNALKYTQQGTIRVSLTQEFAAIKRRRKQHVVNITVEDTGKGIGEGFLEHGLFKPFSQEDSLAPGTGLGLSLVKQITTQLRGRISIESQVGVGTTASVRLPLEQVPESPESAQLLSDEDVEFEERLRDLRGLRIRIGRPEHLADGASSDSHDRLEDICRDWLHMEVISNNPDETALPDLVLWSHDALFSPSGNVASLAKAPNVLLCSNAMVAYRQFMAFESAGHAGIFEFISQPAGPRKLAKTLSLAYQRWVGLSKTSRHAMTSRPGIKRGGSSYAVPTTNESPSRVPSTDPSSELLSMPSSATQTDQASSSEPTTNSNTSDEPSHEPALDEVPTQYLLVDDNYINLKVLAAYMERLGVEYNTAMNGQEAVDAFIENPRTYVCILMDISMPVMDGFEATRHIRAHEAQKKLEPLHIIALSGLASENAQQEALGSGMDLFLTKPVKLKALGNLLKSRGILASSPKSSSASATL